MSPDADLLSRRITKQKRRIRTRQIASACLNIPAILQELDKRPAPIWVGSGEKVCFRCSGC
jgi:hypothetical protein